MIWPCFKTKNKKSIHVQLNLPFNLMCINPHTAPYSIFGHIIFQWWISLEFNKHQPTLKWMNNLIPHRLIHRKYENMSVNSGWPTSVSLDHITKGPVITGRIKVTANSFRVLLWAWRLGCRISRTVLWDVGVETLLSPSLACLLRLGDLKMPGEVLSCECSSCVWYQCLLWYSGMVYQIIKMSHSESRILKKSLTENRANIVVNVTLNLCLIS